MKTNWTYLAILFSLFGLLFVSCSDSDSDEEEDVPVPESVNGFVEMEDPDNSTLTYPNNPNDDAQCIQEHGKGYLSFTIAVTEKECLESCKKLGKQKGICEDIDNIHYGKISVNTIHTCTEISGKKIYMPTQYQHCNHACNEFNSGCD